MRRSCLSVFISVFMSVCLHFLKNASFTQDNQRGVKGNQGEFKGVNKGYEELRGVKRSQEESRGVKRSNEE